ncbi:MAG: DUF1926 domain-containing protein [Deltaproteobacteria bacterium]|nr:DUF1926 domain-containing protein [Deltaproteobacteria bacterium]
MTADAAGRPSRALLLCIHNHQPVGNFDFVLEEATRNAYMPFLEMLARFPRIKVTLHYSGCLLRWLLDNRPDAIALLRDLVSRGQAELLGGGLYEPVLALLPERDRLGQIRTLSGFIGETFGKAPEGIWLAERVWEPDFAATLSAAGVKYLPVDDYHFVRAGLSPEELDGVYLTESHGASVRVFPGSEGLRYLVPFGGVDETLRAIERMTDRDVPYPAAIFADDGEKFGVWPGTHKSVYAEGWLARFFEGIEARTGWLATMTLGEYARLAPDRGRVYLPTCSYIEMGEWTLPPSQAARFGRILHDFRAGRSREWKPFVQGGFFRNFLRKYEESNQLHKRMLRVSDRVEEASRKGDAGAARDALYRAQSNDAYWHGVFGGLYLNHLREAAYANLLRAEAWSDRILHDGREVWTECVTGDLDVDGGDETLVKTPRLTLLAHAHDGGALTEISLPRRAVALGHVLTRRREGYHERLASPGDAFDGSTSIHDVIVLKDPSVLEALAVDARQRASFREAFYGEGVAPEAILSESAAPLVETAGRPAAVEVARHDGKVVLTQRVPFGGEGIDLSLEKILETEAGTEGFAARYRVADRGREAVDGTLVSEWNLNFLSGRKPGRHYEGVGGDDALSSRGIAQGLREFRVVDEWRKLVVVVRADREFSLLRYPIETASLSEAGAEKIHQGICLKLCFAMRLRPGETEFCSTFWTFFPFPPNK